MRLQELAMKVLCVVFLFGPVALAQTATGSISGVVQDESGAVIPGVSITVTNVDQGIRTSLPTNAAGRYSVPSLIPGHYEVQAQLTGFETEIRKGIQVTVGSSLEINLALRVGQVTQETVVTAAAPIIETASSTLSGLVDDRTVRDLPLNGRSFDQLVALQSSAPTFRARGGGPVTGAANVYTVSGARTQSNMYLMDGTEVVGGANTQTMPGGALGKNTGVDAIQEFAVLTSNYSAAYGKRNGGIINIATRSGTNQFHGSAFEFHRNSALDARNFFDSESDPPPFKRNNFGGALGGPVRKDQSFFFGTYEGLREGLGLTNIAIVPDENARQGLLPDLTNPGRFTNVGVAPAMRPYLDALFPLPNGRNLGDGTAEYLSNPNQISIQDFFLVRYDQKISDQDFFFARYNFTDANKNEPETNPTFETLYDSRDQVGTLEWKRAYAATVNALRFGFSRGYTLGNAVPVGSVAQEVERLQRFYPWADRSGRITFASTSAQVGNLTDAGGGAAEHRRFILNQFDVADQVYHQRGAHALQFGVQLQKIQHNSHYNAGDSRGTFQFANLTNLLAARSSRFRGLDAGGNDPTKGLRMIYFSIFLQDNYKVLPNLTLNLGLRYEVLTVPVESSGNRLSNYRYQYVGGFRVLDTLPTIGSPFFQSNNNTLAPRIGFAWDPFGDGKSAVRGGFGIFYDQVESDFRFISPNNAPFVTLLEVRNPPFPFGFSGAAGTPPLPRADSIQFDLKVPTRLQYSLGLQRQITSSSAIVASYVGSHSYHLSRPLDLNVTRPEILPGGIYFHPANAQRLNPSLGSSRAVQWDAHGWYDSLQLDFIQRAARGMRYKISYTFAKNMDEGSRVQGSQAIGDTAGAHNSFERKWDRSLSAFDVRHNLVMNFTYELPWNNLSGLTGRLMGGWQLGGIVTLTSGTPFTVLTGFDRSRSANGNDTDRPILKTGASNNPVLGGPDHYYDPSVFELPPAGFYGNLGRNTLIGPGFANVDMTLSKITSVNERLKVDFRADLFNLLNRANFDLPAIIAFNPNGQILGSAGRIQATNSSSRQIQFGLKLLF